MIFNISKDSDIFKEMLKVKRSFIFCCQKMKQRTIFLIQVANENIFVVFEEELLAHKRIIFNFFFAERQQRTQFKRPNI